VEVQVHRELLRRVFLYRSIGTSFDVRAITGWNDVIFDFDMCCKQLLQFCRACFSLGVYSFLKYEWVHRDVESPRGERLLQCQPFFGRTAVLKKVHCHLDVRKELRPCEEESSNMYSVSDLASYDLGSLA